MCTEGKDGAVGVIAGICAECKDGAVGVISGICAEAVDGIAILSNISVFSCNQ